MICLDRLLISLIELSVRPSLSFRFGLLFVVYVDEHISLSMRSMGSKKDAFHTHFVTTQAYVWTIVCHQLENVAKDSP